MERYYLLVESIYEVNLYSVLDRQTKNAHGDDACAISQVPWEIAQRECYELNRTDTLQQLARAEAEIQRLRAALGEQG